ncbi:MAG: hypothetical protein KIT02_05850 [Devosia sp.]|uniref:hypothetical protein n=1 Tax=Devosia sp. TaxID=1871048 RepID=UPI0024C7AF62|nr:hypothetical protein [Devosia sp.]UYO00734.1 MAG: hypothetical protein KIT02_05850 [Devosia sp.]
MDTKAAILALMAAWGVGTCTSLPALAQDADAAPTEEPSAESGEDNPLLNRVWVKQGDDSTVPGTIHIFLADGTLVSDSCWETYRLSTWQQVSDSEISWDEDGMTISADIAALSADELVLNLKLLGGDEEQRFSPASVPYLCPDMPK